MKLAYNPDVQFTFDRDIFQSRPVYTVEVRHKDRPEHSIPLFGGFDEAHLKAAAEDFKATMIAFKARWPELEDDNTPPPPESGGMEFLKKLEEAVKEVLLRRDLAKSQSIPPEEKH